MADFKTSNGKLVQKSTGKSVKLSSVGGNLSKGIKAIRAQKSKSDSSSQSSKSSRKSKTTKGKVVKIEKGDPSTRKADPVPGAKETYFFVRDSKSSGRDSKSSGGGRAVRKLSSKQKEAVLRSPGRRATVLKQQAEKEGRSLTPGEVQSIRGGQAGVRQAARYKTLRDTGRRVSESFQRKLQVARAQKELSPYYPGGVSKGFARKYAEQSSQIERIRQREFEAETNIPGASQGFREKYYETQMPRHKIREEERYSALTGPYNAKTYKPYTLGDMAFVAKKTLQKVDKRLAFGEPFEERASTIQARQFLEQEDIPDWYKAPTKAIIGGEKTAYTYFTKKPATTAAFLGSLSVAGGITGSAFARLGSISRTGATVAKGIGYAAGTAFAVGEGAKVVRAPTLEAKGETFAKSGAALAAFMIGSKAGAAKTIAKGVTPKQPYRLIPRGLSPRITKRAQFKSLKGQLAEVQAGKKPLTIKYKGKTKFSRMTRYFQSYKYGKKNVGRILTGEVRGVGQTKGLKVTDILKPTKGLRRVSLKQTYIEKLFGIRPKAQLKITHTPKKTQISDIFKGKVMSTKTIPTTASTKPRWTIETNPASKSALRKSTKKLFLGKYSRTAGAKEYSDFTLEYSSQSMVKQYARVRKPGRDLLFSLKKTPGTSKFSTIGRGTRPTRIGIGKPIKHQDTALKQILSVKGGGGETQFFRRYAAPRTKGTSQFQQSYQATARYGQKAPSIKLTNARSSISQYPSPPLKPKTPELPAQFKDYGTTNFFTGLRRGPKPIPSSGRGQRVISGSTIQQSSFDIVKVPREIPMPITQTQQTKLSQSMAQAAGLKAPPRLSQPQTVIMAPTIMRVQETSQGTKTEPTLGLETNQDVLSKSISSLITTQQQRLSQLSTQRLLQQKMMQKTMQKTVQTTKQKTMQKTMQKISQQNLPVTALSVAIPSIPPFPPPVTRPTPLPGAFKLPQFDSNIVASKKRKKKGVGKYKASIGGLLSGKSIIKAPKVKQTGVDIRFPLKEKKRKKKEEELLFGTIRL